jgi:hypothetical protein
MEPKEAAAAAATLTRTISKTTEPGILFHLSQALSAVAARMEPKQAADILTALTQAITETTAPFTLASLSEGLLAVAARLEPKRAAQACGQAAVNLTRTISKTTNPKALHSLAEGLLAVATRMDPKEAAMPRNQAVAILIHAVTQEEFMNSSDLRASGRLSAVLSREPLLPQTLVDILKQPLCVNEVRRLVLDQLSRHYNRPFADQWEFVDFVHTHNLDLDLTTPPQRPGVAITARR